MTGQDGGFRAAAARFSAEVEAALTRARRAASAARAQSAEFRSGNRELAEQAKTGRLRGVHRDQVAPTTQETRDEAAKFRQANELAVEELPDAGTLIDRLPAAEPVAEPEDDDFSQHALLLDVDERAEPAATDGAAEKRPDDGSTDRRDDDRRVADAPDSAGIAPSAAATARQDTDDEDFSQQRILLDVTDETYRPAAFPDSVLGLSDEQNRS
ncbi:hypothetical protein [Actinophytocola sediminis]